MAENKKCQSSKKTHGKTQRAPKKEVAKPRIEQFGPKMMKKN